MDNNKLGLKIVRINQGYTDLLEINGDQIWTKNVWDIRKDLENIDNLDGSSAVLMLTSIDTGHILTVASLIEGRITDCISAWMYVPASINISLSPAFIYMESPVFLFPSSKKCIDISPST